MSGILNGVFTISNSKMGPNRLLSGSSSEPFMDNPGSDTTEQWFLTPAPISNYYWLHNQALGTGQALSIAADYSNVQFLSTSQIPAQYWRFAQWPDGTYRVSNGLVGPDTFLELDGPSLKPSMDGSGDRSSQRWGISMVGSSPNTTTIAQATQTPAIPLRPGLYSTTTLDSGVPVAIDTSTATTFAFLTPGPQILPKGMSTATTVIQFSSAILLASTDSDGHAITETYTPLSTTTIAPGQSGVTTSPLPTSKNSTVSTGTLVGAIVGGFAAFAMLALAILYAISKSREKQIKPESEIVEEQCSYFANVSRAESLENPSIIRPMSNLTWSLADFEKVSPIEYENDYPKYEKNHVFRYE